MEDFIMQPKVDMAFKEIMMDEKARTGFLAAMLKIRPEEFDMLAQKDPYIKSAYEQLQVVSQDQEKRLEYEARQKAIWDYNQMVLEAEERGEERINNLYSLLVKEKRFEDLERATSDKRFRQQLIKEYGI